MKLAVVSAVLLALMAFLARPSHREADDFHAFYDSAKLSGTGTMYKATEHGGRFLPYLRIPSYALMLRPLTLFSYETARCIWIGLLVLAFLGFVTLWPQGGPRLLLALTASMPVLYSFQLGQDIALILLIVAAAVRLDLSGRHFAAGLAISLIAIKISFLIPIALVFAVRSRRAAMGAAIGVAAQMGISFALEGWRWPVLYLAVLRSPGLDPSPSTIPSVRGLVNALPFAPAIVVCAALGTYVVIAWIARRSDLVTAVSVAMAGAMIAAPHTLAYDAVLCLPLFVSVAGLSNWTGRLALLGVTPVPYLLLCGEMVPGRYAAISLILISVVLASRHHTAGVLAPSTAQ